MDDQNDKRMDDFIDTDETHHEHDTNEHEATEHERTMKRPGSMSVTNQPAQPATTEDEKYVPLFEYTDAERFRSRWLEIQSAFIDDPRASVRKADELVAEVINSITENFAQKRSTLENQWHGGADDASTEDMRLAVKRYRSFFERLLTLES